jgi:hypothetical protein
MVNITAPQQRPATRPPQWGITNAGRPVFTDAARNFGTEGPVSHLVEKVTPWRQIGSRENVIR